MPRWTNSWRRIKTVRCFLPIILLLPARLALAQLTAGPEIGVNQFTTGEQLCPTVEADGDGDFVVAWRDAEISEALAQRFSSSGVRLGEELVLGWGCPSLAVPNTHGEETLRVVTGGRSKRFLANGDLLEDVATDAERISVALDGRYVLVGHSDSAVKAQAFEADGTPTTDEWVLARTSTPGSYPGDAWEEIQGYSLAPDAAGGAFVVATDVYDFYYDSYYAGIFANKETRVTTMPESGEGGTGGSFPTSWKTRVVAWKSIPYGGYGNNRSEADVGRANGHFVVVWQHSSLIHADAYDGDSSDGVPDPDFEWTAPGGVSPSVAVNGVGEGIVIFSRPDGDGAGLFGQIFARDGRHVGAEFQVNLSTLGDQKNADINVSDDRHFVAVWEGPDGSGKGIFARQFILDWLFDDGFESGTVGEWTFSKPAVP